MTDNAVLEAINKITKAVGSIAKTGRNQFQNYDYATAADLLHKLQPMLAEAGLVIIQSQKKISVEAEGSLLAIEYEFGLWHTSGAVHPDRPIVTGMSALRNAKGTYDDKAANKCLTAASKYFLINLFKIPTGDYDDADAGDGATPPKKAAPPKPVQSPPAPVGGTGMALQLQADISVLPQNAAEWATKIIEIKAYLDSKPAWSEAKGYWAGNVPLFEGLKDKYPIVYKDVHEAFTAMKPKKETKDA